MNFILSKMKQLLASSKTQEAEIVSKAQQVPTLLPKKAKTNSQKIVELRKKRIWSDSECALLILALEDVYSGEKRNTVISNLSEKLRLMGKKNGIYVDEKYRNKAGITQQMLKMEFLLLTENKNGHALPGASKSFQRVCELYKTDLESFNQKFHLNAKGVFLSQKIAYQYTPPQQNSNLSEKNPLISHTNENNSSRDSTAFFEPDSHKKLETIDGIVSNYIAFTKGISETLLPEIHQEESSVKYDDNKETTLSVLPISEEKPNDISFKNSENMPYLNDINNNEEIASPGLSIFGNKPTAFNLGNYFEEVKTWKNLYISIFNHLIKEYIQQKPYPESITASRIGQYAKLINGLQLYVNYNALDIIKHIIEVLDCYGVSPDQCTIHIKNKWGQTSEIKLSDNMKDISFKNSGNIPYINDINNNEEIVSSVSSISRSKPTDFNLGNYFEEVKTWKNLYVSIFNHLIKEYTQQKPYPESITASRIGKYETLINGLQLYVNYNALGIIKHIIEVLDCYDVSPDQCIIHVRNKRGQISEIKLSDNMNDISFKNLETESQLTDIDEKYSDLSQKIYTVLCEKYQKGFRLDSHLEKERFKLFFKQIHSEKIPEEISEKLLEQLILKNGIVYNDRVYIAENMLDEDTKADLFTFINQSFENGHNTIHYTALFNKFSDKFGTHGIFDSDILREYLKYLNTGDYYVCKEYLSKDKSVNQSISDEINQMLADRLEPFFQDDLCAMLPHIDRNKLIRELRTSSDFISNGREQYFLARNFNITNEEKETVKNLVFDLLNASNTHFVTATEVMSLLHKKLPELFENNGFISELGIRNILASILKDSFSFNGNVISDKAFNLSLNDIFEDFAKNTPNFSLAELKNLASEFSAPIYFDAVNKYAIRINKEEFVGKDKIDFNSKEIDYAISLFCQTDYVPIQAVDTFISFPYMGYQWNTFLLESYLQNYSNTFKLLQISACETKCVGVIVKKISSLTNFDDILADAIAVSNYQLQKEPVLQFLYDSGYIARKTYSSIDNIMEKASQKRNLKG